MSTEHDAAPAVSDEAGRVERWARELCRISGVDPDAIRRDAGDDSGPEWMFYRDDARAAIALADAERAAGVAERWKAYEEARDGLEDALDANSRDLIAVVSARTALDAAVRRLAEA